MTQTYLEREILEQPEVIARQIEQETSHVGEIARAIRERDPRYIMLVARGSSDNAARYGQYLFGVANRLPVALATPSLFSMYNTPPRLDGALVIAVSQSGQSPDIVSVVEEASRQGAFTLAVTNDPESPLAAAAQDVIQLHAGREQSVAATKTYTTSLMALAMLSTALADDAERQEQLRRVPGWMQAVTARCDETIQRAERYRYMDACVVLSRGYNYATAFEVALKLKELTYVLAEPYSSADFKHGPVALVEEGFPVFAIVPEGVVAPELTEFLGGLKERGAELIVASGIDRALADAQTPLPLPTGIPEWLSPLVAVIPGQLFALGLTVAKGYEPDAPRGLRKVTLTQ
ncbi:MAG: SIS domain-containing protein [Chloroflexota bacterium]|nr:MAG: glucosamine--fructose-6-phosphate aminotransferase [Chloroflexota bacterium]